MCNMKTKIIGLSLSLIALLALGGCNGGETTSSLDSEKSTLRVYSFTGGFGDQWIKSLARQYEALNEEISFEEGKKGVQVITVCLKQDVESSKVQSSTHDVLFLEQHDFYDEAQKGNYADITDLVTGENKYDNGKTIESKLSDSQKAMFNYEGKYLALPHYSSAAGFVYNIDLFEEKGYFFAEDQSAGSVDNLEGYFVDDSSAVKSKGPDGKTGIIGGVDYSIDDGLPSTFAEYFILCDYILEHGDYPVSFSADVFPTYVSYLVNALAVDYAGYEQSNLAFTFEGEAKKLATTDANGELILDATSTLISVANKKGKELRRNPGLYYGLEFLAKLLSSFKNKSDSGYLYPDVYSYGSYLNAQKDFFQGHDIAMMVEGMWSENEADLYAHAFSGDERQTKKFGFMPLPKATSEQVGESRTLYDVYFPECFVRSTASSTQQKIAKDFLAYAYSDQGLVNFTKTTHGVISVKYEIPASVVDSMNAYGKSIADFKNKEYKNAGANMVYPLGDNEVYNYHHSYFDIVKGTGLSSKINNVTQSYPSSFIKNSLDSSAYPSIKKMVAEYFNGMYKYASDQTFFK